MYVTGMAAANRAALARSRTCIRSASAVNDGCPPWPSSTTSPSSSASSTCSGRVASSGYAAVISTPERAYRCWSPPEMSASARTPSHLNSYAQPSPAGSGPVIASIGLSGAPGTTRL